MSLLPLFHPYVRRALALLALCAVGLVPDTASANFSGAIYTTSSACDGVNINQFPTKPDVYLDGGPQNDSANGLPDGAYYVKVTTPDGDELGRTDAPVGIVAGGELDCLQLSAILYRTSARPALVFGYDSSPNGVYKVWLSPEFDFPNDNSKTDNFKVADGSDNPDPGCDPNVQNCPPPPDTAELGVIKFYDANVNGINDDGIEIMDWLVNISDNDDPPLSIDRYTPALVELLLGDYTVTEYMPVQTNWYGTTENPLLVNLQGDQTVEFGNVCTGAGGGHTRGFWSNKNGAALVDNADLAALDALALRNATGGNADFGTSYSTFKSWLSKATATNMAYMLSAQLAAMTLNVRNDLVDGDALIYAPDTAAANGFGFATVNAVMTEAAAALVSDGYTPSGDPDRTVQEALKNALDNANNNQSFVQAEPCDFSFDVLP